MIKTKKKRKIIKKLKTKFSLNTIKKNTNIVVGSSITLILCLEITSLRDILKSVIKWFISMISLVLPVISSNNCVIPHIRQKVELFLLLIILLCLLVRFLVFLIAKYKGNETKKAKGFNPFETSLLEYLNSKITNRCYLIDGYWGAGKTYLINSFIKKYYRNTDRSVYNISCVGLSNRDDVVSRINNSIKSSDISFTAMILNQIAKVPVIGDFLSSLLKKEYSYSTINENAIFIFDDFERITAPIRPFFKDKNGYFQSSSYASDIEKNKEICNFLIDGIDYITGKICIKNNTDKYLPIISIICELTERYHHKVIIICDSSQFDRSLSEDILSSKLNRIIYHKSLDERTVNSLINELIDNVTISDSKKLLLIRNTINAYDIMRLKHYLKIENLRFLSNIIEAFVLTADLFETSILEKTDFLRSLFSSILFYYKNSSYYTVVHAEIGTLLSFIEKSPNPFSTSDRWLGYNIASYWFNNMAYFDTKNQDIYRWEEYSYCDIESALIQNDFSAYDIYDYGIEHLSYLVSKLDPNDDSTQDIIEKYTNKILPKYNLNDDCELKKIVTKIHNSINVVGERSYIYFLIAQANNGKKIADSKDYLVGEYNKSVDKFLAKT